MPLIKFWVLLLAVFVGGATSGVLLDRHFVRMERERASHEPYQTSAQILSQMDAILKLTPEQRSQITAVLAEHDKERRAHPEWTRLDRWRLLLRTSVRIRPLLTPEQARTFDQALETLRPRNPAARTETP